MTPLGCGQFGPQGLDCKIYVGDHTKYISCGPQGFREEDFLSFSHYYGSYCFTNRFLD